MLSPQIIVMAQKMVVFLILDHFIAFLEASASRTRPHLCQRRFRVWISFLSLGGSPKVETWYKSMVEKSHLVHGGQEAEQRNRVRKEGALHRDLMATTP